MPTWLRLSTGVQGFEFHNWLLSIPTFYTILECQSLGKLAVQSRGKQVKREHQSLCSQGEETVSSNQGCTKKKNLSQK